jgi:hypothetical protein
LIVTEVALVAVTVNVDELPNAIDCGFAAMVTVGVGGCMTVTKADAVAVPPAPVTIAVYVAFLVGLTISVPPVVGKLVGEEKLLPSVPVRSRVAPFVATTVRVVELPRLIDVGLAVRVTVGATGGGAGTTVTVAVAVAAVVPAAPVAVAVYVVVAAGLTVTVPPAGARVLVVPSEPVTTTPVAFVAATVRVELLPAVIVVGFAAMVTVGALDGGGGVDDTVTVAVAVAGVVPLAPLAVAV